ncbi:conserved hypothetical protein [Talaromyces stipitatus ATCC 10500]|uniref:Uncharacterized protein n=1 Tax=Talaromyces stipitatus (strain ATCC 10500 / CBS 375.48 / QM 6759 / NRRL 1006) TaxID=441959 RepID=B8M369_TALSN|nr:uncharacterized protein TSTA_092910 [Talaromyces stipitatus ATCC 10500]EED22045.1 conserved hypothetical protein [Talaromyces stipitatus ATCC 10500]
MVDTEDHTKSPAESAAGDDAGHSGAAKGAAVKDKECQYCHQAFTSSSLGRHLDQYLFKKKPDGIHDVEEIRRIRSSITRRQARTSTKHDSPDVGSHKSQNESPSATTHDPPARPREGPRFLFNTPSWHATGVINNLPESTSQDVAHSSRAPVSHSPGSLDYASRNSKTKDADTVRALELALQEVLDNIKAATATTRPRLSPFDFDVQAETFPALILKLLPPPPTLFSSQPFSTGTSFPLEPPNAGQLDLVRHALKAHIEKWHNEQLALSNAKQTGSRTKNNHANDPQMINAAAQQHDEISSRHVDLAYQNWMVLSPENKKHTWQLELTRAFVRESEKRKDLEAQLNRVQQEAEKFREQNERLASCQWPREFALFPPDTLPLPREAARELHAMDKSYTSPDSSRWDYDQLVAKWKRVVMHDKSMGRVGAPAYRGLEDPPPESTIRPKLNPPNSESHAEFPSFGYVATATSSANNSGQQTSPYDAAPHQSTYSTHQPLKRQRLMNGTSKDVGTASGDNHYKTSPQLANGNGTGWSPASVQSLLASSNPPSSSVPANTNRYGPP